MSGKGGVIIRIALEFLRPVRQRTRGKGVAGLFNSIGGIVAGVGAAANELRLTAGEQMVLASIREDARRAGLNLSTVELIPLRLHDRGADLKSAEYLAWTNSSTQVYVDVARYEQTVSDLVKGGLSEEQAIKDVRAQALYTVRHELQHVDQFRGNNDKPPATWKEMINFEASSYGKDVGWLSTNKNFLLNDIGARPDYVDAFRQSAVDTSAKFAGWTGLSDADGKAAMVSENFIPRQVQGNTNYAITDLYKTEAP